MSEEFLKRLESVGRSLDTVGPALPIEREAANVMVERALDGRTRPGVAQPWQAKPWLAAAAALLACSVAAGLYLGGVLGRSDRSEPKPAIVDPPPVPHATPSITAEPPPLTAAEDRRAEEWTEEPVAEVVEARTRRPRSNPAQELAAANALRAQKRWQAAYNGYRRIYMRRPNSSEAYAARLAAAELLLRHLRRPKEARAQFEHVIAQNGQGSLAATARHGLARSYRMTGNRAQETAALKELVRHHPQSPLARLATERLRSLSGHPQH